MHLWDIVWVRDLCWIAGVVLILLATYSIRAVILPVLIALALAYMVNPLIEFMHRRRKIARWAGTATVMTAGAIAILAFLLLVVPSVVTQAGDLLTKMGSYNDSADKLIRPIVEEMLNRLTGDTDAPETASRVSHVLGELANLDLHTIGQFLIRTLDFGVGVVGSAISFTGYLVLLTVLTSFCFFFFSWKFDHIIAWFDQLIPADNRQRMLHIIGRMDRSVSAFIRGRLIQSLVMMTLLSIGWWITGVPYFLLLGVISGLLNLVPYAAVVGYVAAVLLAVIDAIGEGSFSWLIVLLPSLVYFAVQLIDGWVVEPLVQGKATDLDPLSVLLVVLIGGSLAGLLGLILAIPAAACIKILVQELIIPKLRAKANPPEAKAP